MDRLEFNGVEEKKKNMQIDQGRRKITGDKDERIYLEFVERVNKGVKEGQWYVCYDSNGIISIGLNVR